MVFCLPPPTLPMTHLASCLTLTGRPWLQYRSKGCSCRPLEANADRLFSEITHGARPQHDLVEKADSGNQRSRRFTVNHQPVRYRPSMVARWQSTTADAIQRIGLDLGQPANQSCFAVFIVLAICCIRSETKLNEKLSREWVSTGYSWRHVITWKVYIYHRNEIKKKTKYAAIDIWGI